MNHVRVLLNSDVKINLTEIVTQNKDVITSKLNLEMNEIELMASRLSDRLENVQNITDEQLYTSLHEVAGSENKDIFVSMVDGNAIYLNGDNINIAGRKYFQLAMEGVPNISDRVISRQSGNDVFILSVPIKVNDTIIGTMQKSYSLKAMYELCSLSLFSDKGYMNIVNKEGYILISSQYKNYSPEKDNYFRQLYSDGSKEVSQKLEKNINNDKAGFFETTQKQENVYSAYTPISGVHDWYLITSIAESAVSPNSAIVIMMFYVILCVVVLVFGCSMLYFFNFKNRQQNNLERIAFVDNITQGNTYAKFMVTFNEAMQNYPDVKFTLLKFDIDNFKYVNNYYGFDFGDKVLYQIYHKIEDALLEGEMICRISSDNFAVLLLEANKKRLDEMMTSIESKEGFILYFSAGIYEIDNREESLALMIDKASLASHLSKGSLVKKVEVYNKAFDEEMIHNEQMKRAVKEALEEKLIIPYYQPKVDVNSGKIVGAEALARWISKDGKIIRPDDFIPLCEKSGLIIDLDMQIFEQVLQFLQERLAQGLACVSVSVNFSRNHLHNRDFIASIAEKVKAYGVPNSLIEIEITESAFFNNIEVMNTFVEGLHKEGFSVSMDDFGSGYSSLNMLKDVQIDVLKIDRAFLIESENSEKQKIIFSAISHMARELEIKVVVEGVETTKNIQMMKMFGCTIAQGYYYGKPMSKNDFENYLKEGQI